MNSKLASLEPDFQPIVEELLKRTEAATNRKWALSDGRRTMARQRELYQQGRTKPGKVVTNAKPGQSAHNFGYAVDLWPLKANGDFDWNAKVDLFKTMGKIAAELGLEWGGNFRTLFDAPHVQAGKWREKQAAWKEGRIEIA